MKRVRTLTDHPMTTGYIEKREFYQRLCEMPDYVEVKIKLLKSTVDKILEVQKILESRGSTDAITKANALSRAVSLGHYFLMAQEEDSDIILESKNGERFKVVFDL